MAPSVKRALTLTIAVFVILAFSILFAPYIYSSIALILCDMLAAGIVFHSVFSAKNKLLRTNFFLLGLAILCWTTADILRPVYTLILHTEPQQSPLITLLHLGTNALLLIALLSFSIYRSQKWDTVQMILDAIALSLATMWFLWIILFDKQIDSFMLLKHNSVTSIPLIGVDLFLFTLTGIWFVSVDKRKSPVFFTMVISFILAYTIADLFHIYLYINDGRVYNPIIMTTCTAALLGIAAGIKLYYLRYPNRFPIEQQPQKSPAGLRQSALILLVYPILVTVIKGFQAIDIAFYAILLFIYEYGRNYVLRSIHDREMLCKERNENKKLTDLVNEQMESLQSANTKLRKRNEELRFAGIHDPLTSLHNRAYFIKKLDKAVKTAPPGEKVALILWNMDNLKGINDTYGHFTGDQILIRHAQRVKLLVGSKGELARLGGDEFAILLQGDLQEEDIYGIARQVVHTCEIPFRIHGYSFNISVGIGIAVYPICGKDRSALLKNADIAMHFVKETKPDGHIASYMDINTDINRKNLIANYLRTADYTKDLQLHYQPQFRIADRKMIGMEALLRWNCPEVGPVSPAEFIPIAEEENMIIPIGNWVIDEAIAQIAKWNRSYHTNLRMGINFSPKQFDQTVTFDVLDAAIKRNHAAFKWIDLEITENVALDFEDSAGNIQKYFKTKQLSISIDDFGTGYSSLGYLAILSFNRLKIAKPLVDKITSDESKRKIITSIILLAKSLDLQTIAEGVETKAQFDLLEKLGCDQIQGYYLGKPVPANEFESSFFLPSKQ